MMSDSTMSESQPIPDAAVRRRALDPTTSFIVQAPAGSGKTELLIQRYLQLLAHVQQPEQILAITFTRKAAAEMHGRVLQALAAADEPAPSSAHKLVTWELARSVRRADVAHAWNLREHAGRLRIQTIDSLNSMLARRLPVLAGSGGALTPAEQPEPLYRAAVENLLQRLADDPGVGEHLERLLIHLGHGAERLLSLLVELLAKRDQWLHAVMSAAASEDLRATLQATLCGVVQEHLQRLCAALGQQQRSELWDLCQQAASVLLNDSKLSEARRLALQWCASTSMFPDATAESLPAWLALADAFCTREGPLYKRMTKSNGFPAADAGSQERARRALALLGSDGSLAPLLVAVRHLPGVAYSDTQWHVLESLLVVLPLAVAELQLIFQARGQADYVEIALRALRALGTPEEPTDLALAFDGRLEHLLVDEFQDTSFAQLELLEQLTAGWTPGDGRTLFCVGDPMQSIYRFRQAEVGLFLNLQRAGLPNVRLEPLRLSANFRAARPLVAWINRVFPEVLASADDVEAGAVKYSACVAALAANEGGVSVHALTTAAPRVEAVQVVEIVRAALTEHEGSIAVLVSAKHHAGVICTELARAQVAFKAVEIAQLGEQTVVQDLLALTRALVHLADRTAWLALLRAPWCGLLLEDLHALVGEQLSNTIHQQLLSLADGCVRLSPDGSRRALRLHAILQSALQERGRYALRDWVERTWNSLGGPATLHDEQELADAEAFFARLELLEQAGDLEDVTRLQAELSSLFAKPQRQAGARVEVMTIHKAKGLEFDTVILPALHRPTRNTDSELLRWTRTRGSPQTAPGIVLAPSQSQGAEADPVYQWLHKLERQRATWERSRLLYVAATRAKHHLHLLGYAGALRDDKGQERKPRAGSMLRMLWHELAASFQAAPPPVNVEPPLTVRVPLQRLPLEWQLPVADAAALLRVGRNPDAAERVPFDWASETARHVGTVVHRELERMTRTGAVTPPGRTVVDRCSVELAELGVPAERCRDASQRVGDAIQRTLRDARGRWLLGMDRDIDAAHSELEVSGVVEGRLVSVVMDRTFIDRQGTRWIVDFKTSSHEGGGLEQFLQEEVARYRAQLTLYARLMRAMEPARPVRTALYFPLLQQWREVV
jgi:ATP-dependent helicase/nuclease subunit A